MLNLTRAAKHIETLKAVYGDDPEVVKRGNTYVTNYRTYQVMDILAMERDKNDHERLFNKALTKSSSRE